MKVHFLETIGAALMSVFGPIHDALLKKTGVYNTSDQIKAYVSAETGDPTNEFAPYENRTLYAYVGGTAVVTALVALLACGKLGKKRPMRRRRSAPARRRRTYRRRK